MNRKISTLSAAIGVSMIWLALPTAAGAAEYRLAKEPIDGQYIVVLKDTAASLTSEPNRFAPVRMVSEGMAASYHATLLQSYDRVLRGFAIRAPEATVQRMLKDSRIAYIEQDAIAHATTTQTKVDWGLARISERANTFTANPLTTYTYNYTYTTTASNVNAYVIDDGVLSTQTDFSGRVGAGISYISDGNGTNGCSNTSEGGHGTHVAGIIGGTVYGVAKGVTLHSVRVLDCNGNGTTSNVIAGVDWVASHHVSPAVANMSLDIGTVTPSLDTAVSSLIASGVTTTVAAGNQGSDACSESPADVSTAITVGSTRLDDGISSFSNTGTCVKIFAPGSQITSDWNTSNTATAVLDGTSMAAPHVAGAAALYLATHPTATPSQVAAALYASASPRVVLFPYKNTTSPTAMLYTLGGTVPAPPAGTPPTGSPNCDGTMGGSTYWCNATVSSASPFAIFWEDPQIDFGIDDTKMTTSFKGKCAASLEGENWIVDFAVANRDGLDVNDQQFFCDGGSIK